MSVDSIVRKLCVVPAKCYFLAESPKRLREKIERDKNCVLHLTLLYGESEAGKRYYWGNEIINVVVDKADCIRVVDSDGVNLVNRKRKDVEFKATRWGEFKDERLTKAHVLSVNECLARRGMVERDVLFNYCESGGEKSINVFSVAEHEEHSSPCFLLTGHFSKVLE